MNNDVLIASLAARIERLEDERSIMALMARHPLSVDGGIKEPWLDYWTDDATVDRLADPEKHSGAYEGTYGKDVMLEELYSEELATVRAAGFCHAGTPPHIVIADNGREASAISYLQLISVEGSSYRVRRVVVSFWNLEKVQGQWLISRRIMRPLGHPDAIKLMVKGLEGTEEKA